MNKPDIKTVIRALAESQSALLRAQMAARVEETKADDVTHYLIYRVLGIATEEGRLIDEYQNMGRFLYKYAGSFLEQSAKQCFLSSHPTSRSKRIPNTQGSKPKTFEIDCLVDDKNALEIKWRDATTDGDHISKEHTRIQAIRDAGYTPIRIMFDYPNRTQAIRIQKTLATLYAGVDGQYYYGHSAWEYIRDRTAIDLKSMLMEIADERDAAPGGA